MDNVYYKHNDLSGEFCPNCGDEMIVKWSASFSHQFLGCKNYPKCKITKQIYQMVEPIKPVPCSIDESFPKYYRRYR